MFKNINESFEKQFKQITEPDKLVESLKECLNKLNEDATSPEDKTDSDLIRSILDKIENRVNAKLTPEEQRVLDKYNIKRTGWKKPHTQLTANGRALDRNIDGKRSGGYYGEPKHSEGTKSKINYADRARKYNTDRAKSNQIFDGGWSIDNDEINTHGYNHSSLSTLQDAERHAQAMPEKNRIQTMKYALDNRKSAQRRIDNADSEKQVAYSKAKATYDDAIAKADRWYEMDTVGASKDKDNAQNKIDSLLKKGKNESKSLKESPSYDMRPQYDARQSFYGKARVDDENGVQTLYSYNVPVARIANGNVELLPKWDWSQTTLRHVKEFLKQNGFEASSLKQMRDTYL